MTTPNATAPGKGITVPTVFSRRDVDPLDAVEWELRRAEIRDEGGAVVWEQDRCEVPRKWSPLATNVVISKYFYGDPGKSLPDGRPERERSVRQLMTRVCNPIADRGRRDGYFAAAADAEAFRREIMTLCLEQCGAFNSPVWFNMGLYHEYGIPGPANNWIWDGGKAVPCRNAYEHPQGSACFIQSVEDTMEGIMALATAEAMLFKYGSGTGSDLSTLRSSREKVSGGGRASGPVSFMRIYDATASVVKSGGKTRRAAKIQTLKCWHPDIAEFIECKAGEEKKAQALIRAGYEANFNGEAYSSVLFQNCNMSVRATDAFLRLAAGIRPAPGPADRDWQTYAVVDKSPAMMPAYNACQLLDKIAESTWTCGDPGLQYEDTIQRWHTCPNTAPINSSNPCCLVGSTLIDTAEGKIAIDELRQLRPSGLPLAFAFDLGTGMPVLRQITRVWKAGETRSLAVVTTDKGLAFTVTREHPFLTYGGEYVEAGDLEPGTRLRKIGRVANEARRGAYQINHRATPEAPSGTVWQSRFMWEQAYGPIPEGMDVHHKNEDPADDRLSNFALRPKSDHRSEHSAGLNNPNAIAADDLLLISTYEGIAALPKRTHKGGPAVTVARWNSYVKSRGLEGKVPLARGDGRIRGMAWAEFIAWIEEQAACANDRVAKVELITTVDPVAVYDLEVEGTGNFAIATDEAAHSIVVHNSEYMFIDDSACNLASVNLLRFLGDGGVIDDGRLRAAVRQFITAQEILVDMGSYPTARIAENSHRFRPLGLGFCNLGALLMACGLPYDSDRGRALAAVVAAIMHGEAYRTSAHHAANLGPFEGFEANREAMLGVMRMHQDAVAAIADGGDPEIARLKALAGEIWAEVLGLGQMHGFRNSQVTVIAPTGTIAFMMDADTTGIEPEIALVKYKNLAGRGQLKLVNRTVPLALRTLEYCEDDIAQILAHIERHSTIEDVHDGTMHHRSALRAEHLDVFDCAFRPVNGTRAIAWTGHVRMMAAVQPFVSGAISKTVNMAAAATPQDIREAYLLGWKLGLKALAVYRDGSKWSQPVGTSGDQGGAAAAAAWAETPEGRAFLQVHGRLTDFLGAAPAPHEIEDVMASVLARARRADQPVRRKLPKDRPARNHRFQINDPAAGPVEGYINVGFYPDTGRPAELFITVSKPGSTVQGLMDVIGTLVSMGLQYGVPLDVFVKKFAHTRFEPKGLTDNPDIPIARSITDYIFRWLGMEFIPGYREENLPRRELAASGLRHDVILDDSDAVRDLPAACLDQVFAGVAAGPGLAPFPGTPRARDNPFRPSWDEAKARPAPAAAHLTGPPCGRCGTIMVPAGPCHRCLACGNDSGGCG